MLLQYRNQLGWRHTFVANDLDVAGTHFHTACAPVGLHQRIVLLGQREDIVVLHTTPAFLAPASTALVSVDLQIVADLRDKCSWLADEARRERIEDQEEAPHRPQPFIFHWAPENEAFRFRLQFKKSHVSKDELVRTLREILAQVEGNSEADSTAA